VHESYRMPRIIIDPDTQATQKRRMTLSLRLTILVLGILLVIGLLEFLHRGTAALIFSLLRTVVMAIWSMFCSIAAACRDFLEYVNRQRS
jgi:hypothetical protein